MDTVEDCLCDYYGQAWEECPCPCAVCKGEITPEEEEYEHAPL